MKETRKNVAIIFGGKSAEHEVSVRSANAIFSNIDKELFNPSLIYIDRDGNWSFIDNRNISNPGSDSSGKGTFLPWIKGKNLSDKIDIYFPVLHGPNGEDGRIQGMFEMAGSPFVGAGSLSSNLAMDKSVSKILFRNSGLEVADHQVFTIKNPESIIGTIEKEFNYPCYLKPNSLGSSVGISRVLNREELRVAIDEAFRFDTKIIVEEEIKGMEYEISVKGNENPVASTPGSFIPSKDFYDYEDKYILGKTEFQIPAVLEKEKITELRDAALKAYRSLYLNGFSRADFFIEEKTGRIVINEINTIPGFTEISMFPKLWEIEGIGFKDLITELIELGFEHSEKIFSKENTP